MSDEWEGLLACDKPSGPTSHDVVAAVRRITGQRRVGHSGTLDPPASGLLVLALGRATRLIRFLPASPKAYAGVLRLGVETTTDDADGEVVARHAGPLPGPEAVLAEAAALLGRSSQLPPRVSARKVGGRRLYQLARAGIAVERSPAPIEVFRFDLAPLAHDAYRFEVEVTAGTYVRALARDLGRRLGCGGTLAELRRTRIGPLDVAHALPLDPRRPPGPEPLRQHLVPLDAMPLASTALRLADAADAERFLAGRALRVGPDDPEGWRRVLDADGRTLGVGERRGDELLPRVVLGRPPAHGG